MSERNVYRKPEDRVLLRTADVYQTEVEDEVATYSERLLAIVADFKNSGAPEGFNAQSMVGKSKRGEVACRLFARIDPETGIVEAAGFKTRGCLAMTGCASALCQYIEGKGVEDVLALTTDDVSALVDGVPSDKIHALYFAVCAGRALVGDFLLNDGATLSQLDEAVPCDELSVPCIMAEHCSLRQSRLECRMDEEAQANELAAHNACAAALDLVRQNSRRGLLTTPAHWADLVPPHLMQSEFDQLVMELLEGEAESATELLAAEAPASNRSKAESVKAAPSRFADRGVGVPHIFNAQPEEAKPGDEQATESPEPSTEAPEETPGATVQSLESTDWPDSPNTIAETDDEEENFGLVPPEGFKLVCIDGEWGLVETDEPAPVKPLALHAEGIHRIKGGKTPYLYDAGIMKPAFVRWAFLAQEGDPLRTFAYCIREESRTYPRPMAQENFGNHPFSMEPAQVEALWEQARCSPEFADINRIEASNGDVYYFSSDHLSSNHAQSLAEWASVERFMNV